MLELDLRNELTGSRISFKLSVDDLIFSEKRLEIYELLKEYKPTRLTADKRDLEIIQEQFTNIPMNLLRESIVWYDAPMILFIFVNFCVPVKSNEEDNASQS